MSAPRVLAALLVLLALQFVPRIGVADAQAACNAQYNCDTREEAYNTSRSSQLSSYTNTCSTNGWGTPVTMTTALVTGPRYVTTYVCAQGYPSWQGNASWGWLLECPAGSTWDDASKTCFNSAQCLARNNDLPQSNVVVFTGSVCMDGCEYGEVSVNTITVEGQTIRQGQLGYTGASCGTNPPAPEGFDPLVPPTQACVPVGSAGMNQTLCIKPDGQHCYSASNRPVQFCWRPGETGQKAQDDLAQARGPGTTPPAGTPPAGETLVTNGDPVTSTSQLTNGTNVTTTTQTFTTGSGTDAGPVDEGEPSDGSGGGSDPDTENPGSVSGGVDCDAPPVVDGDPLLANIILQTWGTRCATESKDAVTSTGEIGDCSIPFTVTGPDGDANVLKLKGIRAEICGHYGDGDGNGQSDWTQGDAPNLPGEGEPGTGEPAGPPSSIGVDTDLLDVEGFLFGSPASAPALGVLNFGPFGMFDLDAEPWWVDLVAVMRAVVLAMCAFAAVKILLGGA